MSEETMGVESTEVSPTTEAVETAEAPVYRGENALGVSESEVVVDDSQEMETADESSNDGVMAEVARIREQLAIQKERNDFLEKMALNSQYNAPVVPAQQAPEYDPDDLATNASVEELVNKRIRAIEQRNTQERILNHEKTARSTYPDYDEVAIKLTTELIKGNPEKGIRPDRGLADALMASVQRGENASELAYRFGMTHPEYSKRAITNGVKSVTNKIEKNMKTPQTLSNASRSQAEKISDDYWNNVSDEELAMEGLRRKGLL